MCRETDNTNEGAREEPQIPSNLGIPVGNAFLMGRLVSRQERESRGLRGGGEI